MGSVTQIEGPLIASETRFAAFFVSEREIEVNVRMRGHNARGVAEVFHGGVDLTLLLENTAEIVARDAVHGIELHGVLKRGAGFFDPA